MGSRKFSRKGMTPRTVGRLGMYRRILTDLGLSGIRHVYSAELAFHASTTAALVRRDIMIIGYRGSATLGYTVIDLGRAIDEHMTAGQDRPVVMVGLGALGRVVLTDIVKTLTRVNIVAAFDLGSKISSRRVSGIPVHDVEQLEAYVLENKIDTAVLAVPGDIAQNVVDRLISVGVRGFLNLTHGRLTVPDGIYIEDLDIGLSLERVAFFSHLDQGEVA